MRLNDLIDWLNRVITQPRDELGRWQRAVRFGYDLGVHGARQLRQDRAAQMAAALSFRTLFGLLPVMLVGTLIVRAVGGFDQFTQELEGVLDSLGLDEFTVAAADGTQQTLSAWLLVLLESVRQVDLAAVTWVGIGVLAYSAVSLLITIEGAFNTICRAPEGRSFIMRCLIYWAVLTIGPTLIFGARWVDSQFDGFLMRAVSWQWLLVTAQIVWGVAVTWLVLFSVYRLLPNTHVATRPALAGALVATLLIEAGRQSLGLYLQEAVSLRQLSGSLGLIPVFMFWVYLMWLVVLFGLEVAATLERLAGRSLEEMETPAPESALVDPASIVAIMAALATRFDAGQPSTNRDLSVATGVPERTVGWFIERLVSQGFVNRLSQPEGACALARPADTIEAAALLDIGFEALRSSGTLGGDLLTRLREAQRGVVQGITLAGVATS